MSTTMKVSVEKYLGSYPCIQRLNAYAGFMLNTGNICRSSVTDAIARLHLYLPRYTPVPLPTLFNDILIVVYRAECVMVGAHCTLLADLFTQDV